MNCKNVNSIVNEIATAGVFFNPPPRGAVPPQLLVLTGWPIPGWPSCPASTASYPASSTQAAGEPSWCPLPWYPAIPTAVATSTAVAL